MSYNANNQALRKVNNSKLSSLQCAIIFLIVLFLGMLAMMLLVWDSAKDGHEKSISKMKHKKNRDDFLLQKERDERLWKDDPETREIGIVF